MSDAPRDLSSEELDEIERSIGDVGEDLLIADPGDCLSLVAMARRAIIPQTGQGLDIMLNAGLQRAAMVLPRWIPVTERLPEKPGSHLVFAPSADPNSPFVTTAWFEPPESRNLPGWQLLPDVWCRAITHWMPLPAPPEVK